MSTEIDCYYRSERSAHSNQEEIGIKRSNDLSIAEVFENYN